MTFALLLARHRIEPCSRDREPARLQLPAPGPLTLPTISCLELTQPRDQLFPPHHPGDYDVRHAAVWPAKDATDLASVRE
jgi:hypothetical protein